MTLKYTNNAQSTLLQALETTGTTLSVNDGELFPDITAEDDHWFPLTLMTANGLGHEIVRATARSGNNITIVRAQEDTPLMIPFAVGDIVSLRMTAAAFDEFIMNGSDDVFVRSLNLAQHSNASISPAILLLDSVQDVYDGLKVSFKPTLNSNGDVTISFNDSDPKPLKIPFSKDTRVATSGDLLKSRIYDIQFNSTLDCWDLVTPIKIVEPVEDANVDSSGVVEILETLQEIFDAENNAASTSGAPKVPTRLQVSKIISDYTTRIPVGYLPRHWTWVGHGGNGPLNGNDIALAYRTLNLTTGTVNTGVDIDAGRGAPAIIRVQETMTINGNITLGVDYSRFPTGFEGPQGAEVAYLDDSGQPYLPFNEMPEFYRSQLPHSGEREPKYSTPTTIFNAIMSGVPMSCFHGGHGSGRVHMKKVFDAGDSYDTNNHYTAGRSGLFIIAKNCVIGDTAEIDIPTVRYTEASRTSNTGYNMLEQDTIPTPSYTETFDDARPSTAGGGGMIIIVSEALTISDSSKWRIDGKTESFKTFSTIKLSTSEQHTFSRFYNHAHQGQLIHINSKTGVIRRWL